MGIWDQVSDSVLSGTGISLWTILLIVGGGGLGLLIFAFAAWNYYTRKKWNLKAEIKLTRSGGRLTNAEWGKAYFNAKRGVVMLKRPGTFQSAIAIPIFDLRKYIQGDNVVTFIQLGPEDYRPVLNNSWEEYENDEPITDKDGKVMVDEGGNPVHEKAALMSIRINPGLNKAWSVAWRQAAKQAYSLKSFFTQFQTPIAIAIVIIAVFVGFAIMWSRLGSVCGG